MDHQLEDGVPQRRVVEGGRAAAALQGWTRLRAPKTNTLKLNILKNSFGLIFRDQQQQQKRLN